MPLNSVERNISDDGSEGADESRANLDSPTQDAALGVTVHVKLVARIAVAICLVATFSMVGTIFFVAAEPGVSYFDTVGNYSLTQERLIPILGISGLFVLLATAGLTWAIAVYTTFRIAGPLYGFAKKLEIGLAQKRLPEIRLRESDQLQPLGKALSYNAQLIEVHLDRVKSLYQNLKDATEREDPNTTEIDELMSQIEKEMSRVRS